MASASASLSRTAPSSLSKPFKDGLALPRVAEQRGLEGVVSKRRDAPYRSGECRHWRKVKTCGNYSARER
jgi:ATP-dependent DNA ligase